MVLLTNSMNAQIHSNVAKLGAPVHAVCTAKCAGHGARLRAGLDALDVVNTMRDDGVLISIAGANEDTLKVRSPLVCQAEHVDLFLASFERTLSRVAV
ncbi:hypothetical protein [Devosia salina]|uniref:hypothetical protein n=1 Tax=Devosia salina TaxID=2860336 RepID=UPI003B835D10